MRQSWGRCALIGDTGFVGGALRRDQDFDVTFNSRTITDIEGQSFDRLICAGAPATMWAANANPDSDAANLDRLASCIEAARFERLVLISTIAVLQDSSARYTESTAQYCLAPAYGRNRRALEERLLALPGVTVLRLPALFGPGLKKNFLFDLMNPVPSFIKPEKFSQLQTDFAGDRRELLNLFFSFDDAVGMHKLDRASLYASPERSLLQAAFAEVGFVAANFTNSSSVFQYYDLSRLRGDIDYTLAGGQPIVHICPFPWRADALCLALTGRTFENDQPPRVHEDMRTDYPALLGEGDGVYHIDEAGVLSSLQSFFSRQVR